MLKIHAPSVRPDPRRAAAPGRARFAWGLAIALLCLSRPAPAADETSTWLGGNGNWSDAPKWSNAPALVAYPNNGNAGKTYDAVVNIGGTVALTELITVDALTLTGGTLNGAAGLTVNGAFSSPTGVTLGGSGTINLNGGGSVANPVTVQEQRTVNVAAGKTFTLTGSAYVTTNDGAAFVNNGTFDITNDGNATTQGGGGAGGLFTNNGTLKKSAGAGSSFLSAPFANAGSVQANGGTLDIAPNVALTHTGSFSAASGATLRLRGTQTFAAASSVGGAGTIHMNGVLTFNGTFNPTGPTLSTGSTTNFNGATTTLGALSFEGGSTIGGSGTVNVGGALSVPLGAGATFNGTGVLNLNGGGTLLDRIDVVGQRTVNLAAGKTLGLGGAAAILFLNDSAAFVNNGTIDIAHDGNATVQGAGGAGGLLTNNGTLVKSAGAGTANLSAPFANAGVVQANSGTLDVTPFVTLSHTGSFSAATGATLQLRGTQTYGPASSVGGAGTIRIGGTQTFNGTFNPTGPTVINAGAAAFNGTTTLTALTFEAGATVAGSAVVNVSGAFVAPVGIGGKFQGSGTLNLNGGGTIGDRFDVLEQRTFNVPVGKTLKLTDNGFPFLNNTAALNNAGTFDVAHDGIAAASGGTGGGGLFTNTGTLVKSAGAGEAAFSAPFTNAGVVQVNAGELSIVPLLPATHTGSFAAAAGTTLRFGSQLQTFSAASSVTGAGTVRVESSATFDGTFAPTGPTFTSGNAVAFNGTTTLGALTLASGSIVGTGTVDVNGAFTANAGGLLAGSGTLNLKSSAAIGSRIDITAQRTVNLVAGKTATLSGVGQLFLAGSGTFNNAGTFDVTNDGNTLLDGGGGVFNNTGTLVKSAGAGTSSLFAAFANAGSVVVNSGTLNVAFGNPTHTGAFTANAGTTLRFGATQTLGATSSVGGAGTVDIAGGLTFNGPFAPTGPTVIEGGSNVAFNGATTLKDLTFSGTLLGGSANVAVSGNAVWAGGTIAGTGKTTIAPAGTLTINTAGGKVLTRTVENAGAATWSAGTITLSNGTFGNLAGGTFNISAADSIIPSGGTNAVNNAGMISKTSSSIAIINVPFNNQATGVVNVNDGTLGLTGGGGNAGSIDVKAGATLRFSGGFNQSLGGTITGQGALDFNAATVTLDGSVAFGGELAFNSASATVTANVTSNKFSLVNSNATVAANGTLNVGVGGLTFGGAANNGITLQPSASTPGKLKLSGDVSFAGTAGTAAINTADFAAGQTPGLLDLSGATRTFDVNDGTAAVDVAVSARVMNGAITKASGGTLRLDSPNAHTSTLVTGGTLEAIDPAALGAGKVTLAGGNLTLRSDAAGTVNFGNAVDVNGDTTITADRISIGTTGALRLGQVKVTGTSRLSVAGANRSLEVTGLTLGSGSGAIDVAAAAGLTVNGPVDQGVPNAGFNKTTGAGRLTFAGTTPNTYAGLTRVTTGVLELNKSPGVDAVPGNAQLAGGGGILRLLADHQIADTGVVTINAGTARLDLNGHSDTFNTLSVLGGQVTLGTSANGGNVLRVTNFAYVVGTGKVDLGNGNVIVDYPNGGSGPGNPRQLIATGYAGGTWTGNGITSSAAAADSKLGIGYAESATLFGQSGGTFAGQGVDGSALLMRVTLAGDATLDGRVDFNDLVPLAQNYNVLDGQRTWAGGDYDYDGNVDFNDLVKLAQNYNAALPGAGAVPGAPAGFDGDLAAAFASVPEPSGAAVLLAAYAILTRRRRRRTVR